MKSFYKVIFFSGVTIFSITLLVILSFTLYLTYKIPFNNYKLEVFQKDFKQSIAKFHPAESRLLAEALEVGNWADGTYCEFLVGQFRSSLLSKDELEKIYPDYFSLTGIYFIDEDVFNHSPWHEWEKKYLKDYKPKEGENLYLVWASVDDNPPDGDIRCD